MVLEAYNGTFLIDRHEMVHVNNPEPVLEEYLFINGEVVPLYEISITLISGIVTFIVDTFENISKLRAELL